MISEAEKPEKQKKQLSKEAIAFAMQGRWREAAEVNKSILSLSPDDVEAYNRLGRAYLELGEYEQSKQAYEHAIGYDPFNAIARKNLHRLKYLKAGTSKEGELSKVEPENFIEEMGKAGVVKLYALGAKDVLARMGTGDIVRLNRTGRSLMVENNQGEYLGQVDPRHAQRLAVLMEGGNQYTAAVVSALENSMSVIIREVYQDPNQVDKLSFPPRGLEEVRPYVTDRVIKMEEGEEGGAEPGYTIIGGSEVEVLREEADEDTSSEEE